VTRQRGRTYPRQGCRGKATGRFRDPADPLKFVIVTSKLLTGFDAPILQVMYLDKPMKDTTCCRQFAVRIAPFRARKTHGLIVDYIGIFDDVARALDFDEKAVQRVVSNIDDLRKTLPYSRCGLAWRSFTGVDRSVGGYEGLMAAQERLRNNEVRRDDEVSASGEYTVLGRIMGSACLRITMLSVYEVDYRWLTQVYESR